MWKLHLFLDGEMVSIHPPGNKVPADIQEDKEALVIRCEGSVSAQAPSLFPQTLQVDNVQVYFLGDGRRRHGVGDNTSSWPSSAIHIQVPDQWKGRSTFKVVTEYILLKGDTPVESAHRCCFAVSKFEDLPSRCE